MTKNVQLALPMEFSSYELESSSEILYQKFAVKECKECKVFQVSLQKIATVLVI